MSDRFSGVRSGAMDDLLIRRVISDARSRLEKSTLPGSKKKKRTAKELHNFLEEVRGKLQRFNIPVPATAIDMLPDPPKGIAWAVKVAICNKEKEPEFIEFVRQQGQSDVYLAALALSSPGDDHGEIRALQAALEMLKESAASTRQGNNAKNPKSPFRALVLSVLERNPNDTVDEIWVKLQGLCNEELEITFNDNEITFDDLEFAICFDTDGKEQRAKSYVEWNIGKGEKTFKRSSLDKMISELREEHRIFKSI